MEHLFPTEIWQVITNFCDPITQIRLCQISKFAQLRLHVTDLYNLSLPLRVRLNDEILKRYRYVTKLDISHNRQITNITHMKILKKVSIAYCEIGNDGIAGLNLIELNANSNPKIINVSQMKSLKILHAVGDCGIGDANIIGLELTHLYANGNSKITDVSHIRSLQVLHVAYNSGINDRGICGLQLAELNVNYNQGITNLRHMKSLQILSAEGWSAIDDQSISGLELVELYANRNPKIVSAFKMKSLKQYATSDGLIVINSKVLIF